MLGKLSVTLFPKLTDSPVVNSGPILYTMGLFTGIIHWAFGLVWFFFAVAAIQRAGKLPFNMGWWGFTFPLGVYSSATLEIGAELDTEFFRILGTIFSISVFVLWLIVAIGTFRGAMTGKLFYAPCLRNLKENRSDDTLETVSTAA
jgi:tellurite resistance protein TehA-like permease